VRDLHKKLLGVAVGTLLAVAGAELIARFGLEPPARGNITPVPREITQRSTVPDLPYVLLPNAEVKHAFPSNPRGYFDADGTLTYRINSLGFRGPETTRERPAGIFRILGVGDSFTFGTGVRQEHTFLARLAERLEQDQPGRCEVLNLGVMGYNTPQELALLDHVGRELDPQLVVVCMFLNDMQGGGTHELFNVDAKRRGLARHSMLADRIVWMLQRRRQIADLTASYHASFAPDSAGWQRAQHLLVEERERLEARGTKLVLMIFPVLWDLGAGYPFKAPHATVSAFAKENAIPVLDLLGAFEGHDGPELWVHATNQHPNEEGHRIAGDALYDFLTENSLLQ
jgi:lysophospholipase L1-like esterase